MSDKRFLAPRNLSQASPAIQPIAVSDKTMNAMSVKKPMDSVVEYSSAHNGNLVYPGAKNLSQLKEIAKTKQIYK